MWQAVNRILIVGQGLREKSGERQELKEKNSECLGSGVSAAFYALCLQNEHTTDLFLHLECLKTKLLPRELFFFACVIGGTNLQEGNS